MTECRTLSDIFNTDYQEYKTDMHFVDYKASMWEEALMLMDKLGCTFIPIAQRSKRPINGYMWANRKNWLKARLALSYALNDYNIAVISGPNNLVIYDTDMVIDGVEHKIPEKLKLLQDRTLTARTPNGYAYFCRQDLSLKGLEPYHEKLSETPYSLYVHPRVDSGYELIPQSVTCKYEKKGHCKHDDKPHDYRVREFLQMKPKLMDSRDFLKVLGVKL